MTRSRGSDTLHFVMGETYSPGRMIRGVEVRKIRQFRLWAISAIAISLIVPALSQTSASSAQSQKPIYGGTLTVAIDAQPAGFAVGSNLPTPGAASVFNEIFSSLTAPTAKGTYAPYLALSVTPNKAATVWVIKLRPHAQFADGTPINSAAVVYNLHQSQLAGSFSQVKSFASSGPLTVIAKMKTPFSAFLAALSGPPGSMASEKALKSEGKNFATKPVGSGPYELSSWAQGNQIVLVRNPHYWRSKPYVSKVIYKIITDSSSRLSALQAGTVNVAELDPAQAVSAGINASTKYKWSYFDSGTDLVYFNTGVAPLDSLLIRKALAEATDRPSLIKSVWQGIGKVANSPAWPTSPYYDSKATEPGFNLNGAQQLVKEYETQTGTTSVTITLLSTNDPTQELLAQALQAMWQAAGITVTLQAPEEAGTQALNVIDKNYQAATFGFPPFADPDQWFKLIWYPQAVFNVDNYKNTAIGNALTKGGEVTAVAARKNEYAIVQRALASNVYALFLRYNAQEAAVSSKVHGLNGLTFPNGAKLPYGLEFGVPFSVESMWISK